MKKPRGLSPTFLNDLQSGILAPVVQRMRDDRTLCLELRGDYVNIYYRGGNLLRLEPARLETRSSSTNLARVRSGSTSRIQARTRTHTRT
jgi:hypothetical protein